MPDSHPTNTVIGSRGRTLKPATVEARQLRAEGKKRCPQCQEVKPLDKEHFLWRSRRGGSWEPACRECNRADCRARHAANPEPGRQRAARWSCENPTRRREISRKGRQTRRARLKEAFVEDVDPQVVFERDEGVCGICNGSVDRQEFDVDHVVPLELGGEHSYANVRLSHSSCNRSRGRATALQANERR